MSEEMKSKSYFCSKCKKTLSETKFYTLKSGNKSDLCKACETMHINNWDPDTYMWLLEKYDVPYIPEKWVKIRDKAYQKDPYKITGMSVLGKYLSQMKLLEYKNYTFADTERLQKEKEEQQKVYGTTEEQMQRRVEEMKVAFERGEITESQYLTYKEIVEPKKPDFCFSDGTVFSAEMASTPVPSGTPQESVYPVNDNPFEKVQLPDITAELTEDDKIYLAQKWGRLYSAEDWIWLEEKYKQFITSFGIKGAARIDNLIFICKTSLKMNQALDSGDLDAYSKLSRTYDSLMKAAKLTEAQRKEEKTGEFDAVGLIVAFAEKTKGKIRRHDIAADPDLVDKCMAQLKRYNRELINNDTALAQQVENYLKRRELVEQTKMEEKGLSNEDFTDFSSFVEQQRLEDEQALAEGGEDGIS